MPRPLRRRLIAAVTAVSTARSTYTRVARGPVPSGSACGAVDPAHAEASRLATIGLQELAAGEHTFAAVEEGLIAAYTRLGRRGRLRVMTALTAMLVRALSELPPANRAEMLECR